MCEPCAPDALLEAVRGLRVAEPDLGLKPLLAKLREQRPELGAATKEVREAMAALKVADETLRLAGHTRDLGAHLNFTRAPRPGAVRERAGDAPR